MDGLYILIGIAFIGLPIFGFFCQRWEISIKTKSWKRRSSKAVKKILKERSALRAKKVVDEYRSISSGTA